jgi:hypothetical protein
MIKQETENKEKYIEQQKELNRENQEKVDKCRELDFTIKRIGDISDEIAAKNL